MSKKKKKNSAQPESNQRPRDINCKQLQSPALPTELYADIIINHVNPNKDKKKKSNKDQTNKKSKKLKKSTSGGDRTHANKVD